MPPAAFDYKQFLKTVSTEPGIYQMFGEGENILYVGKAKNLKKRLNSYFPETENGIAGLSIKTRVMVEKIASIQVTITESEVAALLLEQNLIKALKPPYNISLRDDKSYPYIFISDDEYPRISFHRGAKRKKGAYYGPYPGAGAVYQSLSFLQKTFRIRQCENSVFRNRSRPCLQYQINRCTAPCVDFIDVDEYQRDINHASLFLKGQSNELMNTLASEMEDAAEKLDFEKAAIIRDQIQSLRRVQSAGGLEANTGNIDIFALFKKASSSAIHVMYIRDGRILGSKSYFQEDKLDVSAADFLLDFVEQFYLSVSNREIPNAILLNHVVDEDDKKLLAEVLQSRVKRNVFISHRVKTQRQKWLQMASANAEQSLLQQLGSKAGLIKRFDALQEVLKLDERPQRLECFDISHSSGELTVASCVVFNQQGALKSDYRRFNIDGIQAGDDYAAMEQALTRRYTRLQQGEGILPDILIIDGGKGQLNKAKTVLDELGVSSVFLLGIAKGTTRKAGFETLVFSDGHEKVLNADSPALHLLQEIRDEAHRFAITGHKQRRDKKRRTSSLESIPGIGSKRRQALLRHFGGLAAVVSASLTDLEKVDGISKKMAEDIYTALRNE